MADEKTKSVSDTSDENISDGSNQEPMSYEYSKRLMNQVKTSDQRVTEMQAELDKYKLRDKELKEKSLESQGEYKKLLEAQREETNSEREKRLKSEKNLADFYKLSAVKDKIPGQIKRSEFYNYIEFDNIIIDPETGQIDETSLTSTVDKFVKEYGDDLIRLPDKKYPYNAPQGNSSNSTSFDEEIKTARTQREFDAIRKKYNRD